MPTPLRPGSTLTPWDVSVIIPHYNSSVDPIYAVQSVLAQTPSPREILLIDDASTLPDLPATLDRLSGLGVKVHRNPNRLGIAGNRNRGAELSQGTWLAFLDQDDLWLPGHLAKAQQILAGQSHATLFSPAYIADLRQTPAQLRWWLTPEPVAPATAFASQFPWPEFISSTWIVDRASYLAIGGQDETIHHGPEDFDCWWRLAATGLAIFRAPTPTVCYCWRPHTASQAPAHILHSHQSMARSLARLLRENSVPSRLRPFLQNLANLAQANSYPPRLPLIPLPTFPKELEALHQQLSSSPA